MPVKPVFIRTRNIVTIRVRIEGHEPEPMRVVRLGREPEIGETFHAVPSRFRTNKRGSKLLVVRHIGEEEGITIHYCDLVCE